VQINWPHDLTSEIGILKKASTRCIVNDGLNCIMTLNSCNFQSDSRHFRVRYHSMNEAIATGEIEIERVGGMEMLADAFTKSFEEGILGEFVEDIGLG